jgi:hypothetical protein
MAQPLKLALHERMWYHVNSYIIATVKEKLALHMGDWTYSTTIQDLRELFPLTIKFRF